MINISQMREDEEDDCVGQVSKVSAHEREIKFLHLLDSIPIELRELHIYPHIPPKVLVWLDRANYIKYHSYILPTINISRSSRFPLGKRETFIRYMVRNDCAFVISQLLKDNIKAWLKRSSYYYQSTNHTSYLHFLFHYSIQHCANKCRKCINDKAIQLIGKKWYKNSKQKHIYNKKWNN